MHKSVITAGLCFAALLLGGAELATAQTVLVRGNDTDPATLDHHKTSTVAEANLLRDLYEGLVAEDAGGKVIPGAAQSWEISEDGLTYTFSLRPDAKWSNGDPVSAEDFLFAFRRIMTPATAAGYASVLFPIANAEAITKGEMAPEALGVAAPAPQTLVVTLNAPTPYFLELLTHQTGMPLHRASVEQFGDAFTRPGNLVSNGAFSLESFVPNDKIVMKKNPYFHDAGNVRIDEIQYVPFEDRSACLRRFEAGEVQICSDVPAEQMAYMKKNYPNNLRIAPYLGTYYLPIKVKKEKFADARVRQALSMLIDRDFIAEEVWQGTMIPAYGLVPPGIANYVATPVKLDYAAMDMLDREDAALALFKAAGVDPATLSVQLSYNSSENHKNTMASIADMLSRVGISASLNEMEGTGYFNYLRDDGDFDIARAGWIGDYSDPQNFLFLNESNVSFNYSGWSNEGYDAKMRAAAETTDLDARAALLAEAERMFLDEMPMIPILFYSSRALVADTVSGWEDNLLDNHATRWLSLSK
ncbi:MAG: ABC transporter substrate-binding protein [Rhodobacterales bacterium CG_4_10_14_0_8_um_filter_70_9]|nr:MAG: ABC transporter substrate-binding protein [Rhodobacterales bacterium CG_4_10_14_0_8_um_filter_70_9]